MYKPVYHQIAVGDTVAVVKNLSDASNEWGKKRQGVVTAIGGDKLRVRIGTKTFTVDEGNVIGVVK